MITRIECRNWQSLRKVDLDLGRFTVIVGPSSSGKSALMRAFKAVASNVRGGSSITRGEKSAAITVRTGEHIITLERTETAGTYRIVDADGVESVFTKLNGQVPEQVTQALRIEPVSSGGASVNYASQFDVPFLLGDTGATVARVLGELTNVSVVFEAVRRANKQRSNAASLLKTRKGDLEKLQARLGEFHGLTARAQRLEQAEKLADDATALNARIDRLTQTLTRLRIAEGVLKRAQNLPEVPDDAPLVAQLERLRLFGSVVKRISSAGWRAHVEASEVQAAQELEAQLDREIIATLQAAGVCPTCRQQVH